MNEEFAQTQLGIQQQAQQPMDKDDCDDDDEEYE